MQVSISVFLMYLFLSVAGVVKFYRQGNQPTQFQNILRTFGCKSAPDKNIAAQPKNRICPK